MSIRRAAWVAGLSGIATVAHAHTGVGATAGFMAGVGHPLGGLDHLLAMLAVGLWAAQLGGSAVWKVPLAFVSLLLVGAGLGFAGTPLPLVEPGIVGSVIVMGGLIACAARLPTAVGLALIGVFALFHGHAHGSETPVDASGLLYGMGFALASAALHATGVGIGQLTRRVAAGRWLRLAGVLIAGSGVALGVGL